SEEPGGAVGELSARLRALRAERKALEDNPYGACTSPRASEPELPRPPRHQRTHTHPHHGGPFFSPHRPGGVPKRPSFAPPPQILQRAPGAFSPQQQQQAARATAALVQRPPLAQQQQQPPRTPGVGRPPTMRRRSSPTASGHGAERSTLSSLAPPFEPAAVRSRGPPWGAV
ncbi:hypothetical protein K488DRAFT_86317, partial [Vararia minispora EC-137]